jgi:hypothetical protein
MPTQPAARLAALALTVFAFAGCGENAIDPTPTKQDGTESDQFEQDGIERAEHASPAVKAYCSAGAVSPAQEVGCLSHVTDADIP